MNKQNREKLLTKSWDMHNQVESAYLGDPSIKGSDGWLEKQRLLLADMAMHLFQTAIGPDNIALPKLQNNLHAILTISDQFLPQANLKKTTEMIYTSSAKPSTG